MERKDYVDFIVYIVTGELALAPPVTPCSTQPANSSTQESSSTAEQCVRLLNTSCSCDTMLGSTFHCCAVYVNRVNTTCSCAITVLCMSIASTPPAHVPSHHSAMYVNRVNTTCACAITSQCRVCQPRQHHLHMCHRIAMPCMSTASTPPAPVPSHCSAVYVNCINTTCSCAIALQCRVCQLHQHHMLLCHRIAVSFMSTASTPPAPAPSQCCVCQPYQHLLPRHHAIFCHSILLQCCFVTRPGLYLKYVMPVNILKLECHRTLPWLTMNFPSPIPPEQPWLHVQKGQVGPLKLLSL